MEFLLEYWEGAIGLFALLTAIASTTISFYTFRLQRTHNIKSVKPILHIGQWDYENRLLVTLNNVGAGIGIVKKIIVYNNEGERKTCIYNWLPNKLVGDMNYREYWTRDTEFVVQASAAIKLIEISVDTSKTSEIEERERLRQILGQLTVEVIYEDIYEHPMPITKLQLTLFLRLDNEN